MIFTIHTSVVTRGQRRGYAAAYIPQPGDRLFVRKDDEPWDFARLIRYITDVHGGELNLIYTDLYQGGIGRIAMAIDGQETVVYRVTGTLTKGFMFMVSDEPLLQHQVEGQKIYHGSVF